MDLARERIEGMRCGLTDRCSKPRRHRAGIGPVNREVTVQSAEISRVLERCGWPIASSVSPAHASFVAGAVLLLLAALAAPIASAQEGIFDFGSSWKYFKGVRAPSSPDPTLWRTNAYEEDPAWFPGNTGIGYGAYPNNTILSDMQGGYLTVYTRKEFTVADPLALVALTLSLNYDDGFVCYLNGEEVARRAAYDPGTELSYDTPASASHQGTVPEDFDLNSKLGLLVPGENLMAFEIHNASISNSDLTFNARLSYTACVRGSFTPHVVTPLAGQPRRVIRGDFNGDGTPDLAVAKYQAKAVSVLLGDGHGGLGGEASRSVASEPISLASGDVNRDAKLDLVVGRTGAQTGFSVLLGDGAGGFSEERKFTLGFSPSSLALSDLDSDGVLDLVAGASGETVLSVMRGDGAGGFGPRSTLPAGSDTSALAVADFDGDGDDDLAATDGSANLVSIFLNGGDGTFAPRTTLPTGRAPSSIEPGNLDDDGRIDLLATNAEDGTVSVFLGRGDGSFLARPAAAAGPIPESIAVADLDRDGRIDFATADRGFSTVSVCLGDGLGGFAPPVAYTVANQPDSIVAVDLSRDGRPDLATVSASSGSLSILLATRCGQVAFRRGDASADGLVNIFDVAEIFQYLASQGQVDLPCQDAADVDDDGSIGFADAMFLMTYLFAGGSSPPYPGPERPGFDSEAVPDGLTCDVYNSPSVGAPDPRLTLGFEGCPTVVYGGLPGTKATFEVYATLTASGFPPASAGGAGWSLSMTADGATITAVTVDGVLVPIIPPPTTMDLKTAAFRSTYVPAVLEFDPTRTGAISGVVLKWDGSVRLIPNGTIRLAKLEVEATVRAGCAPVVFRFEDGFGNPSATPTDFFPAIENLIDYGDESRYPVLGSCEFLLCQGFPPPEKEFLYDLVTTEGATAVSSIPCGDSRFPACQLKVFQLSHPMYARRASRCAGNGCPDYIPFEWDGLRGLYLRFTAEEDLSFLLLDSLGERVGEARAAAGAGAAGQFEKRLSVPSLAAGSYFLVVSGPRAEYTMEVLDEGMRFVRADINNDGRIDLSDGVFLLNFLFQGGSKPLCEEASDVNDDGAKDLSDAVSIFNFLFLGGHPPRSPFPSCGVDPQGGPCLGSRCDG